MRRNRLTLLAAGALVAALPFALSAAFSGTANAHPAKPAPRTPVQRLAEKYSHKMHCPGGPLCTEIWTNPKRGYVGHDEPAVNFYSTRRGAGNDVMTTLTLPRDPRRNPAHGGTPNFQLHPAFWFGMAMCDNQSAPNPGGSKLGKTRNCKPDSDSNIYTGTNSSKPRYIGLHPGVAFMEMQFYPPGWVKWPAGDSCSAHSYCAALNIDSLSENMNTGQITNPDCFNYPFGGLEPVNFAFITKNGVAQAPANPVDATNATYTPDRAKDLFMSPGDKIDVIMHDTRAGFRVVLQDRTAHTHGSMTASVKNGFGHVIFNPSPTAKCRVAHTAFHPAYASSTVRTRVPWAAHSYNVGYSDEIGHWETCLPGTVSGPGGTCLAKDDPESTDPDDSYCFAGADSSRYKVPGCLATDSDFDGKPYRKTWAGTTRNHKLDVARHGTPITFTSLRYFHTGKYRNYGQVSFEADLPRIEDLTTPPCQRHLRNPRDLNPGAGCRGLPPGASFYPIFSTHKTAKTCVWREGGTHLPGVTNDFGGKSTTEFGNHHRHLLALAYPDLHGRVSVRYNDFRNVLPNNPCRTG